MNNMYDDCKSESCILSLKDIFKKLGDDKKVKQSFKPVMPKDWDGDDNAWLSTDDIEDSLKQHQKKINIFIFMELFLLIFQIVLDHLCSFNLKEHIKKEMQIGIVFNTHPHTKRRSALDINVC